MKRLDETLCIFVGKVEGRDEYSLILNNDGDLTITELPYAKFGRYKLEIKSENLFSWKRSKELLGEEKTLTLTRMMNMPTGERDRYGDMEYKKTPTPITFKRITLAVEIAYFNNIEGFEK